MTVAELLGKLLAPDSPWLLLVAVALVAAAAGTARKLFASLRRFGARLGALEQLARSEQNRRRQTEAELAELGIPLPYWPEDPDPLPRPRPRRSEPETALADYELPPVPGLNDAERAAAARHRR